MKIIPQILVIICTMQQHSLSGQVSSPMACRVMMSRSGLSNSAFGCAVFGFISYQCRQLALESKISSKDYPPCDLVMNISDKKVLLPNTYKFHIRQFLPRFFSFAIKINCPAFSCIHGLIGAFFNNPIKQ